MAYEKEEIFDNLSELFELLSEAATEDSEGGKTITKIELVKIISTVLPKIGIDVID